MEDRHTWAWLWFGLLAWRQSFLADLRRVVRIAISSLLGSTNGQSFMDKSSSCTGRNAEERKVNLRIQYTGLRWFEHLCLLSESRWTLGQRTRSRRLHRMAKKDQCVCRTPRIWFLAGALPIVSYRCFRQQSRRGHCWVGSKNRRNSLAARSAKTAELPVPHLDPCVW